MITHDPRALFPVRMFDPSGRYSVQPRDMYLMAGEELLESCSLFPVERDEVGVTYKCSHDASFPGEMASSLMLRFTDGSKVRMSIEPATTGGYSPLFSFNGPNPKPRLVISDGDDPITFPQVDEE